MHSFIEQLSPAGALAEPAGRALLACLISFVLTMMFAPRVIRALISLKIGQPIRTAEEVHKLAELHGAKAGTPTMGGDHLLPVRHPGAGTAGLPGRLPEGGQENLGRHFRA